MTIPATAGVFLYAVGKTVDPRFWRVFSWLFAIDSVGVVTFFIVRSIQVGSRHSPVLVVSFLVFIISCQYFTWLALHRLSRRERPGPVAQNTVRGERLRHWMIMIAKLFGRKPAAADHGGLPIVGTLTEGGLRLKFEEVRQLVICSTERRGYPDAAAAMIADRVVWLERRGLPGLAAWILELVEYGSDPLEQRFIPTRSDGSVNRVCPFSWSVRLGDKLDALTSADPDRPAVLDAPSHPVLILPKLAGFLGPHARMITVHWIVDGREVQRSVMDGFRIIHRGDAERSLTAFMHAERIAISRFPEEREPVPPLTSGNCRDVVLPNVLIGNLVGYMKATA